MIIWRSVPASQDVLVNMLRKMVMLIDNLETTVILIDIMDNGHTLSCNRLVPKRWCCFFLYILCIYGRKRNIFIFTMEWVGVWPKLKYCTFLEPLLYRVDLVVRGPPGGKKHITLHISPGSWDCQIENDSWIWSRQEGEHVTHSALYLMPPNFQSLFVVLLDYYCFQAILQQSLRAWSNLSLRCHWFVALNL